MNIKQRCATKPFLICSCGRSGVCINTKAIMNVTKSDGTLQEFSWDKIEQFYKRASYGLNTKCPYSKLETSLKNYIVDWIKTVDINRMIIKSAIDLISPQNILWQNIAWRFMIKNLYKQWSRTNNIEVENVYSPEYFKTLINTYSDKKLYNKKILETYSDEEILELWEYISPEYDYDYNHWTVTMYEKRYLINREELGMMELPQHMYMANAMLLWVPEREETRIEFIKKLYDSTAKWEISLPTPTLLNARTPNSQLSSCFILTPADDLRSIYHNIEGMAQISKNGWGIGVYMWNIRSKWSYIKGVKWLSWGVMPWSKVINDTAVAVNQMGKRAWAISVTLDIFHRDIYDWLEMQTETWDVRSKAFDLFPAVAFPDLFFTRMEARGKWTLFCPYEVEKITGKRLQDHFGDKFVSFYEELEKDDRLLLKEEVDAFDLFKTFLKSVVETWMPYTFFRDTVNKLNPNKHAGNIYCSNLCTEIAQNQSENTFILEEDDDWVITTKFQSWDTVICNLASINVAKVNTPDKIKEIVPVAMRLLDNVIDLNTYPTKETEISAKKYRAVWLGMMWLAQYFAESKILYGSPESIKATNELFKNLAYETLRSSVDLAKERWAYPIFKWSEYSKWIAYWKPVGKIFNLELAQDMMTYWTRFGYHSSPAPNTSTASVVGTTAWVVPVYKKYFVETNQIAPTVVVAPNLNDENFWFYPEYVSMELWGVIDIVATAQKWIDQSVSFEWMINPAKVSPKRLYEYFIQAHKKGLKTVYYVRSQSLEVESCESCSW